MPLDPRHEYQVRAAAREAEAERLAARDRALSGVRLGIGAAFALLCWIVFAREALDFGWLLIPVGAFIAVALVHERVAAALARARRALAFYRSGLARLDGDWVGKGTGGERFLDPAHLYAADLDVFGRGSLYELLCAARTAAGEETLARWLLAPASLGEVEDRQQAVDDLRERLDLREELYLRGGDIRGGFDPGGLTAWGAAPPEALPAWARPAAFVLPAVAVTAAIAWPLGAGATPLLVALGAIALATRLVHDRVERILRQARGPAGELGVLVLLLARIERETFRAQRLVALHDGLGIRAASPSRTVARLARTLDRLDARHNQMFAPFALLLLWSLHHALAIERWRREHGPRLAGWLAAVGEVEALLSLARHAFENPEDPFPILRAEPGARFAGEGLAHPFLPATRAVRNDLVLGAGLGLVVISGSNMSGKSTLLRTVGVNAVLAFAGAPVRARRLELTPFAIGASIRIQDSLQDGSSRFYAEIRRLRQIMDGAREPLLFLLDEVLNGTNSHDRRIGAEAVLRELVARGAIGLVTSHDLALTAIAEALAPAARNAHFEDQVAGDRIHFDYRLREGILARGNALALMRAVGLEV